MQLLSAIAFGRRLQPTLAWFKRRGAMQMPLPRAQASDCPSRPRENLRGGRGWWVPGSHPESYPVEDRTSHTRVALPNKTDKSHPLQAFEIATEFLTFRGLRSAQQDILQNLASDRSQLSPNRLPRDRTIAFLCGLRHQKIATDLGSLKVSERLLDVFLRGRSCFFGSLAIVIEPGGDAVGNGDGTIYETSHANHLDCGGPDHWYGCPISNWTLYGFDKKFAALEVEEVIANALPLGDLIHEMQVERGMSAGFIASQGANFAQELPAQRQRVDAAVLAVQPTVEKIAQTNSDSANRMSRAIELALAMREKITQLDVTVPQVAATYSFAIDAALESQRYKMSRVELADVVRAGSGWLAVSSAKEAAGLERAMGATGFAAGEFAPGVLQRFWQLGAVQEEQLADAELYLERVLPDFSYTGSTAYADVDRVRALVSAGLGQGDFDGMTSPEWFGISTQWTEHLRDIELAIGEATAAIASEESVRASREAYVFAGLTALAIILSTAACFVVTRSFVNRTRNLARSMESVARKDFEAGIPSLTERSEIGDLSRSLDEMRTELQAADIKLREAYRKSFAFGDSDAAMIIVDPELQIVSINDAAQHLFETQAAHFATVLPGFDPKTASSGTLAGLAGTKEEMSRKFSNKTHLPWRSDLNVGGIKLEMNASYVEAEDGSFAGNVIQLRNVTLERLHTGMIRAMERDQCVVELTLEGNIQSANDVFSAALGTSRDDLVGKQLMSFLDREDELFGKEAELWSRIAAGASETPRLKFVSANNETVWIRAALNPVNDADGKIFKIALVGEDITFGVERYRKETLAKSKAEEDRNHIVESLAEGLSNIARGNLAFRIEREFTEEFDALRVNFNTTLEQLGEVMGGVVSSVVKLRGSSTELSSAAHSLAKRTEGQAATLEETAAALEEITATVKSTANQAIEANRVVDEARQGASQGSQTVSNAIEAMDKISASSDKISSIIQVIDDISFQTNLLALNAGVEAARAGDAGRGFAVVASEVRALAQRAAEAAQEISSLITTSQTNVQDGVSLVGSAGEVLNEIAQTVVVASDRVAAISRATDEQAHAIAEINTSVNDMDRATQQNAAMVEEASALSTTLSSDADDLSDLVSAFRTEEGSTLGGFSEPTKIAV